MSIYDQLTGFVNRGPQRTQALYGILENIGDAASQFLSPRGRQAAMNMVEVGDMLNIPGDALDSMAMARDGDYAGSMINVAGTVVPAAIFYKYGAQTAVGAAKAIQETLTGTGDSLGQVGADVYEKFIERMNQPGPGPEVVGSNLGNIPQLNLRDLIGARVGTTVADLTKASDTEKFTGIDSSLIDEPEVLMGGPGYPLLKSSRDNNLIWATQGEHVLAKKLGGAPDLIAVTAMNPRSHKSNITITNSVFKNMKAYMRDGRLEPDNVQKLDEFIQAGSKKKGSVQGLDKFPGFMSPDFDEFIKSASFTQRARIVEMLDTEKARALGAPDVRRILEETLDPRYAGANQGDALMFLRPDLSQAPVNLAEAKLPIHPSYKFGVLGAIEGETAQPISTFNLFSDFWKNEGVFEANSRYNTGGRRSFDYTLPIQKITAEQVSRLEELMQIEAATQKRFSNADIRVLRNSVVSNWKTSLTPLKVNGKKTSDGMSHAAFVNAIQASKYKPALTNYTLKDLREGAKNNTFEAFQLGDDDVFFGIDKAPDYSWMGVDAQPGDKSLVGVVSNTPGLKGQAVPAVMAKAIEEGVTMLDAFAVKSATHPNGFLPFYYGKFGFEEAGRIPFSKEFYIEDHGEQAYKDLLQAWKSDGWSEDQGFPDLVVMRWSGNDADRANAAASIRGTSAAGTRPTTGNIISEARGSSQPQSGSAARGEPAGDGRGTGRPAGSGTVSGAGGTGSGGEGILAGFTESQLKNRGLKSNDIDELKGVLGTLGAR